MKEAKAYIAFKSDPSRDNLTDGMWAAQNNIHISQLEEWKSRNPEALMEILRIRRSRYATDLLEIDKALLAKAKAGDPRSIELLWSRFENWSPRIEEANQKKTGGNTRTFAELVAEEDA